MKQKIFITFFLLLSIVTILFFLMFQANTRINQWNMNVKENFSSLDWDFPIAMQLQKAYLVSDLQLLSSPIPFDIMLRLVGDIDLPPMVFDNDFVLLCKKNKIQLYSLQRKQMLQELITQSNIEAISYPEYREGKLTLLCIESNKDVSSYTLSKIKMNELQAQYNSETHLFLQNGFHFHKTPSEISYFEEKNGELFLCVTNGIIHEIQVYSTEGEYIRTLCNGQYIIPNPYSKEVYCIKESNSSNSGTPQKEAIISELVVNNKILFKIPNKIIAGYFLSNRVIYLYIWDTWEKERFDVINGSWPPVIETYFINIDTMQTIPCFTKFPWKKTNMFLQAFIRQDNCLFIPSIIPQPFISFP